MTIDEIEISLTPEPSPVEIDAATGFAVTWDGNDGDFFEPSESGTVPDNLALATNGTTPFASGELGSQIGLAYHRTANINDGSYGNGKSWIGGSADNPPFAGLDFGGLIEIDRVAWGRDNGRLTPSSEECGGTCPDRSLGNYVLQFTTVAAPDTATPETGSAATGWQTVADINYAFEEDSTVGGGFSAFLRHEYVIKHDGELLQATGLRLITPSGAAVDELEVYGPEDPDVVFGAALTATEILPDPAEIIINEVAAGDDPLFFLEIANRNPQSVPLDGYVLASSDAGDTPYVFPPQRVPAGGFVQVSEAQLGFDVSAGERLFLYTPAETSVADAVVVDDRLRGRSAEHQDRWLFPDVATPGSENSFVFEGDIVINEIMYHDPGTPGTPFTESNEEWIELYNRSTSRTIGLTGWQLQDAVQFDLPAGTTLGPGEYLVIANNMSELQAKYPALANIVGDFGGSLSNRNENIRLMDAHGNPADEVHYFDSGRWAEFADGGGSTLELRDPFADNSLPEAWGASDETGRSAWQTVTYRGVAESDGFTNGVTNLYHEFVFGFLDAGEALVDDISVVEDPDGAAIQRIQNGSFESDTLGAEPAKWRLGGNHHGEVDVDPVDAGNQVLHVTATGGWEDRVNHAETTFVDNATIRQVEYEISFRAKWLGGSNQFNTHLYFNRLPKTTNLERPEKAGTPGAANSLLESNIGPTYTGLVHQPVVPNSSEAVTVSVTAQDADGVDTMTLWYSVSEGPPQSTMMHDSGNGRYEGVIPGQGAARIVQFYVEGTDTQGASSFFPAAGPESRALYKVQDGQASEGALHNFRIVMTSADTSLLHERTNQMSNQRLGATIVYNESEVFYDAQVRLKGSNAGRANDPYLGFNIVFDPMQPFRGVHESVAIDRSGRSGPTPQTQDEILIKHIANRAGDIPHMVDDLVHVIAPNPVHSRTALLMMARYGDEFLDSQYENGSDGTVFKLDIAYVPNGTTNGNPESLKVPFPYSHPQPTKDLQDLGPDKEAYRPHLLIRNNRDADDYGRIVAASQVLSLSGAALAEAAPEVIDVDQWARVFALQSLAGAADVYTRGGLHHNMNFYVRPSDGRVLAFPWDWDFAFTAAVNQPLIGSNGNGGKLMNLPGVRRLVRGHILDIINTTFNNDYLDPWIDHYGAVAGQNLSPIKGYVSARRMYAIRVLGAAIPFEITTNGGVDFSTAGTSVVLEGRGWIDVREIRLADTGHVLDVEWIDDENWRTSFPITDGVNVIAVEAVDHQGQIVGTDTIRVTNTIPNPVAESLRITEINYNPAAPSADEMSQLAGVDDDDFEFVEVRNVGTEPINLLGVEFVDGIEFTFADVELAAGARTAVVKDTLAFQLRYGTAVDVAGQYSGSLNDAGERLSLVAGDGTSILDFAYSDDDPWPERADGAGGTLELVDATATPADQFGKYYRWRGSTQFGGTPAAPGSGPIGVVINEVLSHTDLPVARSDSIELLNTAPTAIDISGWFLSDSADNLRKFAIPAGTVLGPGRYVVFDESDFNPTPLNPGPNDFALSGAHGDDVWLVIPNETGGVGQFADEVHFGAAANGESFGRVPGGTGRLAANSRETLGGVNSYARVGPVIISEIHYAPSAPGPAVTALGVAQEDLQFVEVHNPTFAAVDLTDWRIRGGIDFDFPAGTMLGPQETAILVSFDPASAADADLVTGFSLHHGLGGGVRLIGGYAGRLSDAGELVELQRPDEPPLDEPDFIPHLSEDSVRYDTVPPWPETIAIGAGFSLNRIAPVFYGSAATSWTGGGGSPGFVAFTQGVAGDFTGDGLVGATDIDTLYDAVHANRAVSYLDLDDSGTVDAVDVTVLVQDILGTFMADANLDGRVDAVDLNQIGLHWRTAGGAGWATGDFNGDGRVTAGDLNILGLNWRNGVAVGLVGAPNQRVPRAPLAVRTEVRLAVAADAMFAYESVSHVSTAKGRRPGQEVSRPNRLDPLIAANALAAPVVRDICLSQRGDERFASYDRIRLAEADAVLSDGISYDADELFAQLGKAADDRPDGVNC